MLVTAFLQDFVDWIQLFECVFKCITELSFELFVTIFLIYSYIILYIYFSSFTDIPIIYCLGVKKN